MSSTVEVSDQTFDAVVLKASGPILVDFWATWCVPCQRLAPVVDVVAREQGGKLKVVKLDVDDNPDVTQRYNVLSIPTLILFKDGKEVDRASNVSKLTPKDKLLTWLKPNL